MKEPIACHHIIELLVLHRLHCVKWALIGENLQLVKETYEALEMADMDISTVPWDHKKNLIAVVLYVGYWFYLHILQAHRRVGMVQKKIKHITWKTHDIKITLKPEQVIVPRMQDKTNRMPHITFLFVGVMCMLKVRLTN